MHEYNATLKNNLAQNLLSDLNARYVDASVKEVFSMMFGFNIENILTPECVHHTYMEDKKTAIVGISGTMRGSVQIRISSVGACAIASAMLNAPRFKKTTD